MMTQPKNGGRVTQANQLFKKSQAFLQHTTIRQHVIYPSETRWIIEIYT